MRHGHALLAAALLLTPLPGAAEMLDRDGHAIWYGTWGEPRPGTIPLLLLHGGMMNSDLTFADLIPALAKDRQVIGIDQQGHGHSPDREGPITLDSMAADTLAVLDALKIDRAHVIGFSLGGMLGLDLAIDAPGRVASLAAISASQNQDGMRPALVALSRDPTVPPPPEIVPLLPTPKDFLDMRRSYEDQNPDGSGVMVPVMQKLGQLMNSGWGFSDDQLAGIAAPVMVVVGDRDFILPAHAAHMAATIPDAWLAILPDSTHMTVLDQPGLAAMLLRRIETAETAATSEAPK